MLQTLVLRRIFSEENHSEREKSGDRGQAE